MDLALEFSQQESLSMMFNNDQAGSTTVNYGATVGLRGLNSYPGSTSAAAFGTNGPAITNGRHTVLQVAQASAGAVAYNDLANLAGALPSQYWTNPTTAWMMHPTTIGTLRKLKASSSSNNFLEVGDDDGGAGLVAPAAHHRGHFLAVQNRLDADLGFVIKGGGIINKPVKPRSRLEAQRAACC